ncbi:MAG: hypothetical protein ACC662_00130 [Planctomycetota bacterium]
MSCLLVLFAFVTPRVVLVLLFLFGDYLGRAYDTVLWPLIGFVFLPTTTLAYAWAQNSGGGVRGPFWIFVMIVAVMIDVGAFKEGTRKRRIP